MKISVVTLTYGHEKYIKQAIDGVLMQKGNFDIEMIIANDNSPDNTDCVVQNLIDNDVEIAKKIKYTHHSSNIGVMANFIWALNQCTGEYIALCDGDDYWTDPLKLEKQINILQKSPQFSACYTNAIVLEEANGNKKQYLKKKRSTLDANAVIFEGGGLFPTASFVFRNVIEEYPDFMLKAHSGDRALSLLLAMHGGFCILEDVTCVYRVHTGGVFSNILHEKEKRNLISQSNIQLLEDFNIYSNFAFRDTVNMTISKLSMKILLNRRFLWNKSSKGLYKNLIFKDWISLFKNKISK